MSSVTQNLHLALTGASVEDKKILFEAWRSQINGEDATSNMNLIDAAIAADRERLTKLESDIKPTLKSFGITANASEINKLDGVTATTEELNCVDGVTSNIQDQLNSKAGTALATKETPGLMSAEDKQRIENLAAGENAYIHPTYYEGAGVPDHDLLPSFGESFLVSQPISNKTGHIIGINQRSITIPSTIATIDSPGLMSANDKARLATLIGTEYKTGSFVSANCIENMGINVVSYIDPSKNPNGVDEVAVCTYGKNLFSRQFRSGNTTHGFTITYADDGSININGTRTSSGSGMLTFAFPAPLPPGTYTLSLNNDKVVSVGSGIDNGILMWTRYSNGDYSTPAYTTAINRVITFTTDLPILDIRIRIGANIETIDNLTLRPQLEVGSPSTQFESYKGQVITVSLPDTVYRGIIDWANGTATSFLDANGDPLPEPIVFQITPRQFISVDGVNHIQSDCGETGAFFNVTPYIEAVNNVFNNAITGLSVDGKTVTYTKGDGSTGSITTQDTTYTHPTSAGNKHIPSGGSSGQILRWSSSGTAVWGNDNNTTYDLVTASSDGLMSSGDKTKLDGIEPEANKTVVDSAMSATSTNPVQNKVIQAALEANKTTVDSAMSATSTNPVQNKVIQAALDEKMSFSGGTAITSGSDLNDIRTPGVYISGTASVTSTLSNKPTGVGTGFRMIVVDGYVKGRVTQFVIPNSDHWSYRFYGGSAWTAWATIYSSTRPPANATTSENGLMSSADKTKLDATNIAFGTCATAADVAEKVITTSGDVNWTLSTGSMIVVKFTNTNTASNPTFNVDGTGAKPVLYNTSAITTASLGYAGYANRYGEYMYDGEQYVFVGWSYDTNSTYTNAALGQGYATCTTAAATVAKIASLSSYALTTGGIVAVKFSNAVPANATLNINSRGAKAIYHRGAAIQAGVIKAGDVATFIYSSQYHLISVDSALSGGDGTVKSVNDVIPDTNGNVVLTAKNVGALSVDKEGAVSGSVIPINANTLNGMTYEQLKASILAEVVYQ